MTPTEALGKMLTDSDHFFKYYPVKMFGGALPFIPNGASTKQYRLCRVAGEDDGRGNIGKQGHLGATRSGRYVGLTKHDISSFQMMPDGIQVGQFSAKVDTCGVPMVNYNSNLYGGIDLHGNLAPMTYYVADASANYMTTGELSGCCFAWTEVGGDLRCIHILPAGNLPSGAAITGAVLQTSLRTTGRFQGMPTRTLETFGFLDYGMRRASVIGVRTAGSWKLYAQVSTDRFRTISEAWQIHPGPRRQLR